MTKQFLTSDNVFVVKGYLSSDKTKVQPIGNKEFIEAQKEAEYLITFADMAKGRDFIGKGADSIQELKRDVLDALSSKGVSYIKEPKKVERKLHTQLKKEALDFMKYNEDIENVKEINNYLQRFNVIKEFEDIGLFFEDEIVKINRIYTIPEITKAAESVIDLID